MQQRKNLKWISLHRGIDLKGTGVTRSARHLRYIIAWKFNEGFDRKTMIKTARDVSTSLCIAPVQQRNLSGSLFMDVFNV